MPKYITVDESLYRAKNKINHAIVTLDETIQELQLPTDIAYDKEFIRKYKITLKQIAKTLFAARRSEIEIYQLEKIWRNKK